MGVLVQCCIQQELAPSLTSAQISSPSDPKPQGNKARHLKKILLSVCLYCTSVYLKSRQINLSQWLFSGTPLQTWAYKLTYSTMNVTQLAVFFRDFCRICAPEIVEDVNIICPTVTPFLGLLFRFWVKVITWVQPQLKSSSAEQEQRKIFRVLSHSPAESKFLQQLCGFTLVFPL